MDARAILVLVLQALAAISKHKEAMRGREKNWALHISSVGGQMEAAPRLRSWADPIACLKLRIKLTSAQPRAGGMRRGTRPVRHFFCRRHSYADIYIGGDVLGYG